MRNILLILFLSTFLLSCTPIQEKDEISTRFTLESRNDKYALEICIMSINRIQLNANVRKFLSQQYIYDLCLDTISDFNEKHDKRNHKT